MYHATVSLTVSRKHIICCVTQPYHLLYHTTISLTVHLPLVLTLISNSPRILISRQTIGIEIDNSITYRYADPPICYPVTMSLHILSLMSFCLSFPLLPCLYILCPLCHYGIRSLVTMSLHTLSIMSLCLPFPLLPCLYILCPLCLPFILSVIMASVPYVIMSSVHSVCHYGFCPLCHYVFRIILSVISSSFM